MADTATAERLSDRTVDGTLTFTVDTGEKPVSQTHGPGGLLRHREGTFEEHVVTIHDGRAQNDSFSLDREGFRLVEQKTEMKDFFDIDELKRVFYPEIEELVKQETGAKRVLIFDHTLRSGDQGTRDEKKIREPVTVVHNDYTEWSGPQRVRDLLPEDEAEELLKGRVAVVQVWRAITKPIQRSPLAMCKANSIEFGDLIASERRHPDRIGEIYQLSHNPSQDWVYFPEMTRDEALVFKCYDSDSDRARFTAHGSFEFADTAADAPPRESIEIRTIAFF